MSFRKLVIGVLIVLLVAVNLCLNSYRLSEELTEVPLSDFNLEFANLVADLKSWPIGYLVADPCDLSSVERDRIIRMNWELCPRVVTPVSKDTYAEWRGGLVTASRMTDEAEDAFEESGFMTLAHNEGAALRSRFEVVAEPRDSTPENHATMRGLLGIVFSLAVIGWIFFLVFRVSSFSGWQLALAAFVLVLLGWIALQIGLTPPNGLAVYGGKARMFLLNHGVPKGYWRDVAYAVYQPSYPPLMTFASWLALLIGGVENVYWMPLMVPSVLALVFLAMCKQRSAASVLMAFTFISLPVAQEMAIGFYAEPLCVLFLLGGVAMIQRNRSAGWLVLGCAGLVRHEGLMIAVLTSCFSRMLGYRFRMRQVLLAALPGVLWQLWLMGVNCSVQGFDFSAWPSLTRVTMAVYSFYHSLSCPIGVGAVCWIMVLIMLLNRQFGRLAGFFAFVFVGITLMAIGLACSKTAHYDWMLANLSDRCLWLLLAVPFYNLLKCDNMI